MIASDLFFSDKPGSGAGCEYTNHQEILLDIARLYASWL